jgi:ATP/maltotriose-dependent transcriptional regulator MalT
VFLGGRAEAGSGLPLITEALALFDQAPPSAEHAEALFYYSHYLFTGQGRREEAVTAVRRGLAIAEAAGATTLIPRMQPLLAYHHFLAGQMDEGFALLRHGRALAESGTPLLRKSEVVGVHVHHQGDQAAPPLAARVVGRPARPGRKPPGWAGSSGRR